jgi:hypothetical protein
MNPKIVKIVSVTKPSDAIICTILSRDVSGFQEMKP